MPQPVRSPPCPFVHRLITLLAAELPASPFITPEVVFRLLCDLEAEAEYQGASELSKRAIKRVRRWAGDSLTLSNPSADPNPPTLSTTLRTVYYSGSFAVGWTSSQTSLLSAIQTARHEMIRNGADAAQIIEDDGLGAVVWSGNSATNEP
ncbi:hypothetical protein FOHLNKBM_6245 [Methylobacterium longum]|nr:hypothetical protein FOHLNKBM_6245 [Methylobacterium longum]